MSKNDTVTEYLDNEDPANSYELMPMVSSGLITNVFSEANQNHTNMSNE